MRAVGITSVRELARQAGTHHPTISNWLNGKAELSKDVGRRVAEVLGVSVEKVLFDWAPPKRRVA